MKTRVIEKCAGTRTGGSGHTFAKLVVGKAPEKRIKERIRNSHVTSSVGVGPKVRLDSVNKHFNGSLPGIFHNLHEHNPAFGGQVFDGRVGNNLVQISLCGHTTTIFFWGIM